MLSKKQAAMAAIAFVIAFALTFVVMRYFNLGS